MLGELLEGPDWVEDERSAIDVVRQRYVDACQRLGFTPRVRPRPISNPERSIP